MAGVLMTTARLLPPMLFFVVARDALGMWTALGLLVVVTVAWTLTLSFVAGPWRDDRRARRRAEEAQTQ
jgi:hypothetical protein